MVSETSRKTTGNKTRAKTHVPEKPVENVSKSKPKRRDRKTVGKIKKDKKSEQEIQQRKKFHLQWRQILLPESVLDAYQIQRILKKMEKYRRLFVSSGPKLTE